MREYTYEETLAELRKVVAEKGEDFVYYGNPDNPNDGACFYVKDGEPDCGVGHVLVNFGVAPDILDARSGPYGHYYALGVLKSLEDDGIIAFDHKSCTLLHLFQQNQDMHVPWGSSLKSAVKYVQNAA